MGCQCQYLTTVQTEFLVIVQDCVHVFDPECIHWSVEHDPVFLTGSVFAAFSDCVSQDTINPLSCGLVEHSVQLSHRNGFRIQNPRVDLVVSVVLQ